MTRTIPITIIDEAVEQVPPYKVRGMQGLFRVQIPTPIPTPNTQES